MPNRRRAMVAMLAATTLAACSSGGSPSAPAATPRATSPGPTSTTLATTSTSVPTGAQTQRLEPSLPVAIQEAAAATVGDRIYVVGGYDLQQNSSSEVFVFDGTAWQRGPTLPIAVNHPGAAAIGNDLYVAGGFTPAGATNRAFVLAAGATAWRELPSLHQARGALSLESVDGRLFAIGGRVGAQQIAMTESYNASASAWENISNMPSPRNHTAGYLAGASVCVAGGRTPATSAAVDCMDPTSGTWTARPALPIATSGAAAAVLNGETVVAGGEPSRETQIVGVVQRYAAGAWHSVPMIVPRHGTAFAIYHGRLWMCGGATAAGFHAVSAVTSLG